MPSSRLAAPTVAVVGNSVLDLLVLSEQDAYVSISAHTFDANTEFLQHPIQFVLGGGGANAAYVLARLGRRLPLSVISATIPRVIWSARGCSNPR